MKKRYKILDIDPLLRPFASHIEQRMEGYFKFKTELLGEEKDLGSFANAHLFFGFHKSPEESGWYYREWLPNPKIKSVAVSGDFNGWDRNMYKMEKKENGVWEIFIPGTLPHGSKVKITITAGNRSFDRIPLYCRRVVQDPGNYEFCGQIWDGEYNWQNGVFDAGRIKTPLIYESHVGMCSEEEKVAGFVDYINIILPRVKKLGYNTIQLMAVMEHPFYGSFGYQVSNFYAVSSRFGTPEELKELIDTAHGLGICVLLDLVHSHIAPNALDGPAQFDGTDYQLTHAGKRGDHPAWGTKLFDYGKQETAHFLLSNLKFWLEEYRFDGFRFDGVTSMLYKDHGLGGSFDSYEKYFSYNTDLQSVIYLQLAAELCKQVRPGCILIAEDMSGLPGMCLPVKWGGVGFDYRLGMGIPDFWIKNLKSRKDEDWHMGDMWYELNQRRPRERVIGYAESHDQALVGDKTIIFWLADKEMYWHMNRESQSPVIDRALSLHKLIRLITCMCAGEGYLNFMGNEFGHPEWIDFPRPENNSSFHYARRLWRLADDDNLKYIYLQNFDSAMLALVNKYDLLKYKSEQVYIDEKKKAVIFKKNNLFFAFNFHVSKSYDFYKYMQPDKKYIKLLDTSWEMFGGWKECDMGEESGYSTYADRRTAAVFEAVEKI
ncbi:MAG: alpha-amylase family glycosyl hydrolase [Oscillospiraceae bacterium]|nr:alpha-amylase family glycosyl hydrolase [Oscillospiraceae bacterium]